MSQKIYVGNLSYSITNEELNEHFSNFGEVESAKIIMDRDTGRSKGFAFIEMSDKEEALAAIEALNGQVVSGRPLNVSEAKPMKPRENTGFRSNRY